MEGVYSIEEGDVGGGFQSGALHSRINSFKDKKLGYKSLRR